MQDTGIADSTETWSIPDQALDEQLPISVLLLDDEKNIRDLAKQCLISAGCSVMTAREGSEGLQILLSHRFDVVVTDLMMAPMDGITFLGEALRIWPWMGVVVFSGYVEDDIRARAAAIGVHSILEKPVSFHELATLVKAEAERMRSRIASPNNLTLDHIQYQLSILRENTRTAMEATSLEQALGNLSRDLGQALPSVATAILSRQDSDGKAIMVGTLRRAVTQGFLDEVEERLRERYKILTGTEIPESARLQVNGEGVSETGIEATGDALTFPIISNGTVTGILIFVPPADYPCSDSDISFLYHAANHLTTVLIAFHRIRELAVRDELTGLYNRHHLQDELPTVWQMAARYGFSTSILILDIDHFKLVNDNYGHITGDRVLKELGYIARHVCRNSDLIARYGGDEIIVLLPDADPASLGKLANRMIEAVRAHTFCADDQSLHCTISIGAAGSRTRDGAMIDSDTLLARADEALYVAKRNGRDRSHVWTEAAIDMHAESEHAETDDETYTATTTPRVLVVDDDSSVLKIIEMLLEMEGFSAQLFETGTAAHEAVSANPGYFDIALIDLNLNDMSGLDLTKSLGTIDNLLVKIVITGDATLDNAVNSLRHGAYDFIQKPIQINQLRITMNRAVEYHRLRVENQSYQQNLEDMVRRKSSELTIALQRARDSLAFTLRAMASMLDAREHATGAHSQRVQDITCLIARDFGMQEKQLAEIRQGALLHDIGKIATPDAILLKAGPLDEDEWKIMRHHVVTGYELISKSPDLKDTAELMLCHHEAFDGSGYPNGLRGEQIPLGARIFALVDAYDAMRSDRPYRKGMPREAAMEEIKQHSGSQFDPAVVAAFVRLADDIEAIGNWTAETQSGGSVEWIDLNAVNG
jgi:diguanylate cyclase (GGDEF)-like protein/putative nucleotidyltransferase with HDIG domain